MKHLLIISLIFISQISFAKAAEGYTAWATPTEVELVNDGLLIRGTFGNPAGCGESDMVFVRLTGEKLANRLSMAITAMATGMKIRMYIATCDVAVTAHYSTSINISNWNPFYIKK
jgi:hypothetical protein